MKGNKKVIDGLNEALGEELAAISQYFLHSEMCENWGFGRLAGIEKKQSIDEMKHAEQLIERILFLDGMPDMAKHHPLTIGKNVPEMIANDLKLELGAVAMYNRLVLAAFEARDNGTAELLKKILQDEEGHVDKLEEQRDKIEAMGLQNYLVVVSGE
jgi:bacterioferritin